MATRAILCLTLCLLTAGLTPERGDELIVWNVGQGQWVTVAIDHACWHFDAGGEFAPGPAIRALCGDLDNRVSFSHWDLDHVSFAGALKSWLPNACVQAPPLGPASPRKLRLLSRLPACPTAAPFASVVDAHARHAHDRSRVAWWKFALIPGDATVAQEKAFAPAFARLALTRWLVLGHHGSRTSTSDRLLIAMPHLRAAIASARRSRYGHPHAEVRARLLKHGIPLLSTEDWGHVHAWL